MSASTSNHLLAGIRVLDLSRVLAGPFCAQHLADLGAHVTKIEQPGTGDETRGWGPPFQSGISAYYTAANRNKEVIALDLAAATGRSTLESMLRNADIVVENFLPDSLHKLRLRPQDLHAINPRLIICSISGFGRNSSLAQEPGYDFAIQAMSGLMAVTGEAHGPPQKVGVAVTDVLTSLYASTAILAALHGRSQTQRGFHIDLALWDCAVASQVNLAQSYLMSRREPERQGNAHLQIVPYQVFATSDQSIVLAIGNDGQWRRFCDAASLVWGQQPEYRQNADRVRRRTEFVPKLAAALQEKSAEYWLTLCRKARIPAAPIWTYQQVFDAELCRERTMIVSIVDHAGQPLKLLGSPFKIEGATTRSFSAPQPLT